MQLIVAARQIFAAVNWIITNICENESPIRIPNTPVHRKLDAGRNADPFSLALRSMKVALSTKNDEVLVPHLRSNLRIQVVCTDLRLQRGRKGN